MAKQTFTVGQVLTAANMTNLQQTALGGGSTTAKTASYTLVAADAGTVVQMNSASATTITVNTALFAAGDTVQIQNVGSGVCTVTAGSATVSTSSTLALKQYDGGSLYFNTTSAAIFFAFDAADASVLTFAGALASTRAAQNISNNTFTAVALATQSYSTNSIHSTTVNNTRFTIPSGYTGKWLFYATGAFDSMGAGSIQTRFYKNGTSTGQAVFTGTANSGVTAASISVGLNLTAGDYVELMVFQNTGITENLLVSGSEDLNFMGCTFLGA